MRERSLEEDEIYEIPKVMSRSKVESEHLFGCQMLLFNNEEDTKRIIIYLHGGIYVNEIRNPHIIFCNIVLYRINSS